MAKSSSKKAIHMTIKIDQRKVKDDNPGWIIDNLHRGTGIHRSKRDYSRKDKYTKRTRDYL